ASSKAVSGSWKGCRARTRFPFQVVARSRGRVSSSNRVLSSTCAKACRLTLNSLPRNLGSAVEVGDPSTQHTPRLGTLGGAFVGQKTREVGWVIHGHSAVDPLNIMDVDKFPPPQLIEFREKELRETACRHRNKRCSK